MPVKSDKSGLEKFIKNVEETDAKGRLPFEELFNDDFMRQHTSFQNLQAMLDGASVEGVEEVFEGDAFDQFVARHSKFANSHDMMEAALGAWYGAKFTKGL